LAEEVPTTCVMFSSLRVFNPIKRLKQKNPYNLMTVTVFQKVMLSDIDYIFTSS